MLRRQDHVGRAEEGIGSRGEDADHVGSRRLAPRPGPAGHRVPRRAVGDGEIHLGPFAASDPVALHVLDRPGPIHVLEVLDQPLGVSGHRHPDDREAAALALAVDHLLIGQHGPQGRAPIDGDFGPVGQPVGIAIGVGIGGAGGDRQLGDRPALAAPWPSFRVGPWEVRVVPGVVDLQEDPLGPLVVARIGRIDLAVPVVGETQRFDLPAERIDIILGGDSRVDVLLDRVLLGGQAEGIPAHGVQDVVAAHPLVSADDIRGGVSLRVPHMQPGPAGIGEHIEDVELGTGPVQIFGPEGLVPFPLGLPLRLDALGVIRRHG